MLDFKLLIDSLDNYDIFGKFMFSADNEREAKLELEEYAKSAA